MKHGALIALANKFGGSAYTRARPTLKRKFQGEERRDGIRREEGSEEAKRGKLRNLYRSIFM